MPTRWPIRAYLLIAAIALSLLAVVVGYTFAARAGKTSAPAIAAHAPVTLPDGVWQAIVLPVPPEQLRTYAVAPNDPATLFACTGPTAGPVAIWYTHDTGATWTRAALPATPGTNACDIAFAPDRPGRVAVLRTEGAAAATLALSDDGGATWRAIPHPTMLPTGTISSWTQILVSARSIYVVTSYYPGSMVNGAGVSAGPQATQLERSDDGGASWVRADGPFAGTLYIPWQQGDGDTLLASVLRDQRPYHESVPELWFTHDGGRTWRQRAVLPVGVGSFVLAPQRPGVAPGPTPSAPYYALIGEQLPISLFRLRVLQSGDAQHWTALPPLPVPGTSPTRAGYLQALGVAPDGRLLVFGPDPREGVPAGGDENGVAPAVWLWLWNPRAARWEVLATPLRATSGVGCGLCWSSQLATGPDGATYLYVSDADTAALPNGAPGIFRVRLPAAASH